MAITRFTPRTPSFMDRFMENDLRNLFSTAFGTETNVPAVNVKENDKEIKIEVAAPGMKKEDFDIEMENGTLTISSEHKEEKKEDENEYACREFNYQAFRRTFTIPEYVVDRDKIDAKYHDGILEIHLPKTEEAKTKPQRKIEVK